MIKLYGSGKNLGLIDASPFGAKVHAFLASFTHAKIDNAINTKAKVYKNLVAYIDRITNQYFNK